MYVCMSSMHGHTVGPIELKFGMWLRMTPGKVNIRVTAGFKLRLRVRARKTAPEGLCSPNGGRYSFAYEAKK